MAKAVIEVTMQQLIDALGIDVPVIHEVSQNFNDRISGRMLMVVEANWESQEGRPPRHYLLNDVPMRIDPSIKE